MKKNFFMLAATAALFAACAETDLVNEVNTVAEPQAIGFETFANKVTRAEISDENDLASFDVWGYKAPTPKDKDEELVYDYQNSIFSGTSVTKVGGVWKPETTKYWDRTSTYKFYAVSPSQPTGVTYGITPATGMITIEGAEYAKSGDSQDYLIDRDGSKVNGAYTGSEHPAVELDFHHIMSKLSFKLKSAISADIVVTGLTMTGWDSGKGNFTQILKAKPSVANHTSEWEIPSSADGIITLVGPGAKDDEINLIAGAEAEPVKDTYIMVPQIIAPSTLTFTIDFEIGGEVFTAQVGTLASQQVWGTDTHTTYTISVGPDVIDFNVTNVCGWDAGTPNPGVEIE